MDNMSGTSDGSSMASGMFPTNAVSLNQAKVSIHALPKGVAEGDTVTLKVTRIDPETNSAYLEQEGVDNQDEGANENNEGGEKEGSEETTDGAVSPDEPQGTGINTDTLLGPMGKLKNYLAQKSVDNQSRG